MKKILCVLLTCALLVGATATVAGATETRATPDSYPAMIYVEGPGQVQMFVTIGYENMPDGTQVTLSRMGTAIFQFVPDEGCELKEVVTDNLMEKAGGGYDPQTNITKAYYSPYGNGTIRAIFERKSEQAEPMTLVRLVQLAREYRNGTSGVTLEDVVEAARQLMMHSSAPESTYTLRFSSDGKTLTGYTGTLPSTLEIPEGTTTIGMYALQNAHTLEEVKLPSTLTAIQGAAFANCSNLSKINIPNGVRLIGNSAFYECLRLTELTLPETATNFGSFAFCGTGLTSISFPAGTTNVPSGILSQCHSLKEVTIPEGVTDIGFQAFYLCENLSQIVIPATVQTIGEQTFYMCHGLSTLTIPEGCQKIDESAMAFCSQLKDVYLPASLTTIGHNAFQADNALRTVHFGGSEDQWKHLNTGMLGLPGGVEVICNAH